MSGMTEEGEDGCPAANDCRDDGEDGSPMTTVGDDGGAGKTRVEDEVRIIGVVGKSLRIADNTA